MVALDEHADEMAIGNALRAMQDCEPRWSRTTAHRWRRTSSGSEASRQDAAVAVSLRDLRHGHAAARAAAARSLACACDAASGNEEVIDALLGATISTAGFGVRDKASEVRAAAVQGLGVVAGSSGHSAVTTVLIELFEDSDWAVRQSALAALVSVAAQGHACREQLIMCMQLGSTWTRVLAAQALGHIAPRGDAAVCNVLAAALGDEDWAVQKEAASSLGRVAARGDVTALDALLPLLEDADWRVRKSSLLAVGDVAARGDRRAIAASVVRLRDDRVCAPHRLDQGVGDVVVCDCVLCAL